MSGKFIVFEGIDNSGKTTVSKAITDWLQEEYKINAVITRHPGSTPIGREIRQILKHSPHPINANAQALLFAADNSIFMDQILKPNLEKGNWVIGDRNNFISSLAYQIASGCSFDELDDVHRATKQVSQIDLLLVFHCDYDESQRRRALKGEEGIDRFEDAGKAYFDKLANCYNSLIKTQNFRLSKFVRSHMRDYDNNRINRAGPMGHQIVLNAYDVDAMQPLEEVIENVKSIIREELLQSELLELKQEK